MSTTKDRLEQVVNFTNMNLTEIADKSGLPPQRLYDIASGKTKNFSPAVSKGILSLLSEINPTWLLTGEGEMLNTEARESSTRRNLIPIYESVETIGGTNIVADVDTSHDSRKVEKIDVGNLFWGATSIIRHSGESMVEYKSGTMLAVMRITDHRNIATGKNYVIETDDYRVTKQLVDADDEYFMAYSTNTETRPDGSLVYAPFRIYKEAIRHIDLVIGSVNIER